MSMTVKNTPWVASWVDELASGKYPKTIGKLHRPETIGDVQNPDYGFCCIGVLAKSEGLLPCIYNAYEEAFGYGSKELTGMPDSTFDADHGVAFWVLDGLDLYADRGGEQHVNHLPSINDHYGLTHPQHADLIRYFGIKSRS